MLFLRQFLKSRYCLAIAALLVVSQLALLGHVAFEEIGHAETCEICLKTQQRLSEASAVLSSLVLVAVFVGLIRVGAPANAAARSHGFQSRAPPLR